MNQLTTVAALPSGAGCKAEARAEAIEALGDLMCSRAMPSKLQAAALGRMGYQVNAQGQVERMLPIIDADLLDTSEGRP